MTKPPSIARFEQLYLASFVIGLIGSIRSWDYRAAIITGNPLLTGLDWVMPATLVVGALVTLSLWVFIVHRPNVVAKWIVVVFAGIYAIGLVFTLFALATGRTPSMTVSLLSLFGGGLYIAAAALLFRPDAKAWLGESLDEEPVI